MEAQVRRTEDKEKEGAKMNITIWGIVGVLIMFVAIIGTGFWISSGGKPYNTGIFTIHKLITIAAVVVLAIITVKTHKSSGLNAAGLVGIITTGILLLGDMATGGMLSVDKIMPSIVGKMHQILPYLTTVSTGITLFLLK